MNIQNNRRSFLALCLTTLLGAGLYSFQLTRNPAGFFVDESSISYNAYTISQTGRDEFGNSWPLFFRAFGDYKNPVHIYLLALLFKFTGPSILTARLLSAFEILAATFLLGWLAFRLSKRVEVGLFVSLTALLTPWLFELSRVTLEVALYPLALGLFLWTVWRASTKEAWSWRDAVSLAFTLALLTYSYSIGRLLAPLMAFGLIIFLTRGRLRGLLKTWVLYALTLLPLIIYQREYANALTARFNVVSYIRPGTTFQQNIVAFLRHYLANLSLRRLLFSGDPNIYQVVHMHGQPAMLLASVLLAILGICLVLIYLRGMAWWRFILYGLVVSVVPASLTVDYFHMLRLVTMPLFILLLMVPALEWLLHGGKVAKWIILALAIAVIAQGIWFQRRYHEQADSPWRLHLFDARYPQEIFDRAVSTNADHIYLADAMETPYIQAYWYATLRNIPLARLVRLDPGELPPPGAVVISTKQVCARPNLLAQVEPYTLYIADHQSRPRAPLPDSAFRAALEPVEAPATVAEGTLVEMRVKVRNTSNTNWPGCEEGKSAFQIYLGSHWLDSNGNWLREEGRTPLLSDLGPGQEATLKFSLIAPTIPGDYLIELDLLQEGVSWFGVRGSPTVKVKVTVE